MIKDIFEFNSSWIFCDSDEKRGIARWNNQHEDILSVNYFNMAPDLNANLDNLNSLRKFYRTLAEQNGLAPLEIDVIEIQGLKAIKTIFKFKTEPTGFAFIGSFTFPFDKSSYVIKIQSLENGLTGIRESTVLALEEHEESDSETGKLIGWEKDPYDPTYNADFMANASDKPEYDSKFPEHPLSRLRSNLNDLSKTIKISNQLFNLAPFDLNNINKKPWWKLW